MDEMKPVSRSLLNIPPEVIEEILLYLTLPDRKNLRLTCKQLYELCNYDRFCSDEKVIWSEDLNNYENVESDLSRIGRQIYNLEINGQKLEKSSIFPFFEKHGVKVRSLVIHNCDFRPGSLEFIIMQCEDLRSLCITERPSELSSTLRSFTFEPLLITRPNVTHLKLTLPENKPSEFFHPIISIFPNVKQLHLEEHQHSMWDLGNNMRRINKFPPVLDDITKLGGTLECLELRIPLHGSIISISNVFEALPHLIDLTIYCAGANGLTGKFETWFPKHSNLVSVKFSALSVFDPRKIIRLLTNTQLKYLSVQSNRLTFNEESFEKLVTSQLDTITFYQDSHKSGPPVIIQDSPLEANRTVKNLDLKLSSDSEWAIMLFVKYFRGLIHLSISNVTDSILQSIFQFQENLRSLELVSCRDSSINGFCGSKDGGSEYSLYNLQKLEHLSILFVRPEVVESDDFKRVICLSQLSYLRIDNWYDGNDVSSAQLRHARIPTVLYENLTELRALRLRDNAMPSRETLLSLFSRLKHLNYLRFDMNTTKKAIVDSVTFININCPYFSIPAEKYKCEYTLGYVYFDKELDRLVISNAGLKQTFHMPKIGAFEIDWLKA